MLRLIAQAPMQVDGAQYVPGDVLPASLHNWALLPQQVRRGSIWVDGSPSSPLLDAATGKPVELPRSVVVGAIRRGTLVGSDPAEPAPLHAAALERDMLVGRGLICRHPGPVPQEASKKQKHTR